MCPEPGSKEAEEAEEQLAKSGGKRKVTAAQKAEAKVSIHIDDENLLFYCKP